MIPISSIVRHTLLISFTCAGIVALGATINAQTTKPPPPTKPGAGQPVKPGATPAAPPAPGFTEGEITTLKDPRTGAPIDKPIDPTESMFTQRVESAQGMGFWLQHSGVQVDLHIEQAGKPAVDATLTYDIKKNRSRIERKDGVTMVFDGEHAWISPSSSAVNDARFQLLNLPFFLSAPFRMQQPNFTMSDYKVIILKGVTNYTKLLKHGEGSWGSIDDWYRIYVHSETQFLHAIAYQVTPGTNTSEADKQPHALVFSDYAEIERMQLPMTWTFWNWNPDWGIRGESTGNIKLTNLKFIEPADAMFARPVDAKEDAAPPKKAATPAPAGAAATDTVQK